ncbi:MAG: amylo-alpha-1,6-glucosidase [Acidobacteriota bacterium]
MISLSTEICTNFAESTGREWLETNGIGGFASGSISGALTRRYHGLLTAATEPPLGRITMLSKFEETLIIGDDHFELSTNEFPGKVFPDGYKYLTGFRLDPFPIWTYEISGVILEKRIFMPNGENTTVVRYKASGMILSPLKLELRPLLSYVDYHHLQHVTAEFNGEFSSNGGVVSMQPYPTLPNLNFGHNALAIEKSGYWYRNFEDEIERERGFDYNEDLFQPFVMTFDLAGEAIVIVSTDVRKAEDTALLEPLEVERRRELITIAEAEGDFTKQLVLAADQFIVDRGEGETVIAGYPWFSDWGRDTMIALPGLTLATNRPDVAKDILLEFSKHVSKGMLPNRFADAGGTAEYNTVDATLWYFEAIRAYVEKTGDLEFVLEHLYETLADIVVWHMRGTRYNIHVDTDGLLYAGEEGVQLTWMDAKVGDRVITPRIGKPVEIQALWFNALIIMSEFAEEFGDKADKKLYLSMAELCKQSFNGVFWNDEEACLYDVVVNGSRDASIRPNQILAASLKHSMLDEEKARKVVEKVEAELLTSVGLRSLSPKDSRYVGIYIGSPVERDSAYHQGTTWGWLIGGYVDAHRRVFPDMEEKITALLAGFERTLHEGAVGQVAEIFDGDAPHRSRGCFAQAWSVAELLRVMREQII